VRIVLPVETIVRELKGKLWLALNLIDSGHEVVFGELSSIKQGLDIIQPDVFFRTSTVYSQSKLQHNTLLQENGADIVVLDTEGGTFKTHEHYRKRRLSPAMLDTVDRFFAWGAQSATVVSSSDMFPSEKCLITGNPRFDVLQSELRHIYKKEGSEISAEFGDFVLVNTNFGTVNSHGDAESIPRNVPQGKLFHAFVNMCYRLSEAFPDLTVIVRPHPGENHETYEHKFATVNGVAVEHTGDVRSWIYHADAVIHNNCTTGIEAALMEKLVFAYSPADITLGYSHIANAVSDTVKNIDKMETKIEVVRQDQQRSYPLTGEEKRVLKQYIHNVDSSATDRIVEEVNQLNGNWNGSQKIEIPLRDKIKRAGVRYFGVDTVETVVTRLTGRGYDKLRQKFPQLTRSELSTEISAFSQNMDTERIEISRFDNLGYVYLLSAK